MQQFRTSLAHETDCERGLATSQPGVEGTTESVATRVLILLNESHILERNVNGLLRVSTGGTVTVEQCWPESATVQT